MRLFILLCAFVGVSAAARYSIQWVGSDWAFTLFLLPIIMIGKRIQDATREMWHWQEARMRVFIWWKWIAFCIVLASIAIGLLVATYYAERALGGGWGIMLFLIPNCILWTTIYSAIMATQIMLDAQAAVRERIGDGKPDTDSRQAGV